MTVGKLIMRVASAATSVVIAGGALLAAGGSAAAATASVNEHAPRVIAVENSEAADFVHRHPAQCDERCAYRTDGRDPNLSPWSQYRYDGRFSPWIYDQLMWFRASQGR